MIPLVSQAQRGTSACAGAPVRTLALAVTLAAAAALVPPLAGQSTRIVPHGFGYDAQYGRLNLGAPFSHTFSRAMQVFHPVALGFTRGSITAVEYRRTRHGGDFPARVRDVIARAGYTAQVPRFMSRRFSEVPSAPLTTVFNGPINLPAEPNVFPSLPPWSVSIPFAQPFPYDATRGNLVLDVEGQARVQIGSVWDVDAHWILTDSTYGSSRVVGTSCPNQAGVTLNLPATQPGPSPPGRELVVAVSGFALSTRAALVWLGPLRSTPLGLGGIGAPGCDVWVDPLLQTVIPLRGRDLPFLGGAAIWEIPPLAALNRAVISAQALALEPRANPLGLITSDARELTLGTLGTRRYATQTNFVLFQNTDDAAQRVDELGPVVRLVGTFP